MKSILLISFGRSPIVDIALTQPSAVKGFRSTNLTSSSCQLTWLQPEAGHSCLKAYSIKVETHDGKIFKVNCQFKALVRGGGGGPRPLFKLG
jgi:hypothetical protein